MDEFSKVASAARTKPVFLRRNPTGYFISSMLAGVYVGFGVLLAYTIGSLLDGEPYARIIMGVSFGIALSLVIMAGSELFTGNNMVLAVGVFSMTVSFGEALLLWAVCYIGNWLGSILLAAIFYGSGLAAGAVGEFINVSAAAKTDITFFPLFLRGIFCNILVCLAVWCSFRCKSESGKLIIIFWCLFAFVTSGFEHSIANMTLLSISIMNNGIGIGGYFYNILIVTLGNMAGGIFFVALPYYLISKKGNAKF